MVTITNIIKQMRDNNVGVEDISTHSQAVAVKDGFSLACLRSQNSLNISAHNAFIKAGKMEFILLPKAKNASQLKKSECGNDYAVMLVVLRPRMQEILHEKGGGDLCDSIGPFDSTGRERSASTVNLSSSVFTSHILRTIYNIMVCMQCMDSNTSINSSEVEVVLSRGRHGVDTCTKIVAEWEGWWEYRRIYQTIHHGGCN